MLSALTSAAAGTDGRGQVSRVPQVAVAPLFRRADQVRSAVAASGPGNAIGDGVAIQRMFKRFSNMFGGSDKPTTKPTTRHDDFEPPKSSIPMSTHNFIPPDELAEINQRQGKIIAHETKQDRDKYIAPFERMSRSMLTTLKNTHGHADTDSDFSSAAFDGVLQGTAENALGSTNRYRATTQSIVDEAGKLSTNKDFDAWYKNRIKPGIGHW
jgi:hypothetical protein